MQPARRRRVETGVPAAGDRIYGTGYGILTLNNHTGRSWWRRAALAGPCIRYRILGRVGVTCRTSLKLHIGANAKWPDNPPRIFQHRFNLSI